VALRPQALAALHAGSNVLAIHCRQTVGGQGVDLRLLDVGPRQAAPSPEPDGRPRVFSLLGTQTPEAQSGRCWSDSYLALTAAQKDGSGAWQGLSGPRVSWVGAQSVPEMLPPYFAGAATSKLVRLLAEGHHGVELSQEERDRIACWIDLNVPYCGDYTEANAWSEADRARYQKYLDKRLRLAAEEQTNIQEYLAAQGR
jgi:hypothetical protein